MCHDNSSSVGYEGISRQTNIMIKSSDSLVDNDL